MINALHTKWICNEPIVWWAAYTRNKLVARLLLLFFFFHVSICMANSHSRPIHVDACDRSESSITNAGLGVRPLSDRVARSSVCGAGQLVKGVFVSCWVSVPAAWPCWFCPLWLRQLSGPVTCAASPLTYRGDPPPSLAAPQHVIFPRKTPILFPPVK